jgi:hypothetical protein
MGKKELSSESKPAQVVEPRNKVATKKATALATRLMKAIPRMFASWVAGQNRPVEPSNTPILPPIYRKIKHFAKIPYNRTLNG